MNKKNIYILGGGALLIGTIGFFYVRNINKPSYQVATVKKASIMQEASAGGSVASPTTINLQFQNQGKLAYVGVKVGDKVTTGKMIARQDISVLSAQLQQAQAAVDAQLAQLDTLKQGTRPEQLAILQSQVTSDETALAQANQNTVDAIKNAYTVSDNAIEHVVDHLFNNAHSQNPQILFLVSDSQLETDIESARLSIELVLAAWEKKIAILSTASNLGAASIEARSNLAAIIQLLANSSTALSKAISNQQASQDQLNQWMTSVATARAALDAANSALTSAMTRHETAVSVLEGDQKSLILAKAGSATSVISAQQAVVAQAQAQVAALRAQITQATLVAPVGGTITQVNGEVGEIISLGTLVASIIPDAKLQTNVNLSEDNVGNVKVGNPVHITLDAFPGVEWQGVVSQIDPAQTIIAGAVYYKTTVLFNQLDNRIKSGMTANVLIETGTASSTLVVPASAIQTNGTSTVVELLQNGKVTNQIVTTGLKSQEGMVEITFGLSEGDQIIIENK